MRKKSEYRSARRAAAKGQFREAQGASPEGRRSAFSFNDFWRTTNDEAFGKRFQADRRRAAIARGRITDVEVADAA